MGDITDFTGTISGGCFAPGELLGTSTTSGEQSGTSLFGNSAEIAIGNDYQAETNPALLGIAALRTLDCDWFDTGDRNSYIEILKKNHPKLSPKQIEDEAAEIAKHYRFQWPDILTADGAKIILGNKVITRGRYEFYEIKPDSVTGLAAGEEKLQNIPRIYKKLGIRYDPGKFYPSDPAKKVRFIQNRSFVQLVRVFMVRHAIKAVSVYLKIRLAKEGLIAYRICIEIGTDDKRKQQALARAAAKHLYAAHVICHAPERFKSQIVQQLQRELGDYSFEGDKVPVVRCSFSALDTLKPFQAAIEQAINMRGLGLPGEEYLICCDEDFYKRVLAPKTPDYVGPIWAKLSQIPIVRAGYDAATYAWQKWAPVILKGSAGAQELKEMYPDRTEFANQVIDWIARNPDQAIALVLVGVVLTASVVVLLDAAVGGAGLLAFEGAINDATTVPTIGTAGRFAAGETLGGQMFSSGAGAGTRLLDADALAATLGQATRGAVVANDTALVGSAIRQLAAPAAKFVVPAAAAAFWLMSNVTTAYAQTTPSDSAKATDKIVVSTFSHLFLAKRRAVPTAPGMKPPLLGSVINLMDFAELQPDAPLIPERPRVQVVLAGRVMLS